MQIMSAMKLDQALLTTMDGLNEPPNPYVIVSHLAGIDPDRRLGTQVSPIDVIELVEMVEITTTAQCDRLHGTYAAPRFEDSPMQTATAHEIFETPVSSNGTTGIEIICASGLITHELIFAVLRISLTQPLQMVEAACILAL
jgi:hypothetical protein